MPDVSGISIFILIEYCIIFICIFNEFDKIDVILFVKIKFYVIINNDTVLVSIFVEFD